MSAQTLMAWQSKLILRWLNEIQPEAGCGDKPHLSLNLVKVEAIRKLLLEVVLQDVAVETLEGDGK